MDNIKKYNLQSTATTYSLEMYLTAVKYSESENLDIRYKEAVLHKERMFGWDKYEVELFYKVAKEL
jgi:hypothetical protein